MNFDFNVWLLLKDIGVSSFNIILLMTLIVVPLLAVVEILKDWGIMAKVANWAKRFTKHMDLPGEAAIGLVVGFCVGLVFGSGVIYDLQQDVNMNKTQLNTLFIGIGICHAIFEETAVYTATGANLWSLLLTRIFFGVFLTYVYLMLLKLVSRRSVGVSHQL